MQYGSFMVETCAVSGLCLAFRMMFLAGWGRRGRAGGHLTDRRCPLSLVINSCRRQGMQSNMYVRVRWLPYTSKYSM